MKKTFAEELNEKFAGRVVRNVHERQGEKYTAIVVEFETENNEVLFLVADSKHLIYHEESGTVEDQGDFFLPEDCILEPGWRPPYETDSDQPSISPATLDSMENL